MLRWLSPDCQWIVIVNWPEAETNDTPQSSKSNLNLQIYCTSFGPVDWLRLTGRRVTATIVAKSFSDNGKCGLDSLTQKFQAAMRFPMAVINCIKAFVDMKNPKMCPEYEMLYKYDVKALVKLATIED